MRPHQWVKNLFCVAPLAFSKNLNNVDLVLLSVAALAIFSVLSSSVYLVNDLFDIEKDREHPTKRHRPIPSVHLVPTCAWRVVRASKERRERT